MYCRNCGKQLPEGARFCSNCGSPLAAPAEPWTPAPVPKAAPDPETPEEEGRIEAAAPEDGKGGGDQAETGQETPRQPAGEEAPDAGGPPAPEDAEAGGPPGETGRIAVLEAPEEAAPEPAAPAGLPGFDLPGADPRAEDAAPKRRGKAVFLGLGAAAAALLIALVLVAVKLISGLMGAGGGILYVYLSDDGELMYLPDLKEDTKAVEITDEASCSADVQFSADGKTVYFCDADSTLYQVSAAGLKKEGQRPDRISRDVESYRVLGNGGVLFSEYTGGSYKLSLYEDGKSARLVKSCASWSVSEDGKTLYYTQDDKDGRNLYRMALSADGEEEKLLDGYDVLYGEYSDETLVYGVQGEGRLDQDTGRTSGNAHTMYSCKPGEKGVKLASEIYAVSGISVDGDGVSFYYTQEDVEKHTLYDFVTDSMASEDAAVLKEDLPPYPSWYSEYYPDTIYAENNQVYCIDSKGDVYPVEIPADIRQSVEELMAVLPMEDIVQGALWWEFYDAAYNDALARYNEAMADYEERYEKWSGAQEREYIRESLKEARYDQISYSLYHYTGSGDDERVASGMRSGYVDRAGDIFVYRKKAGVEKEKVADVSELDYAEQVNDLLGGGSADTSWYQNVGGRESVLDIDGEDAIYSLYRLSDKEVVVYANDGYEDRLDSYAVGEDGLTLTDTICEGDVSISWVGMESGGKPALYLFTDLEEDGYNTVGDFCVYRDGELATIAKEVYGVIVLDGSGDTYVAVDLDSEYSAEIAAVKDGKATTIIDGMDGAGVFLENGQILYISDSDLYLWDGKESRRVARDVEAVWASREEAYSTYVPDY